MILHNKIKLYLVTIFLVMVLSNPDGLTAGLSISQMDDASNFVVYSNSPGDWYMHIDGVGDVNGDGYDDFIIGNRFDDDAGKGVGKAHLFFGKADWDDLNLSDADASFIGEATYNYLGNHVTGLGDVNNDGYDDFGIEAIGNSEAGTNAGQTYIFLGSTEGWDLETSASNADGSYLREGAYDLAHGIYAVGDVNGDNYDDFIAAGYANDENALDAGQVYLVFGSEKWEMDISLSKANASYQGEVYDWLGIDAAGIGDVNNDGYNDFAMGSFICEAFCSGISGRSGYRKVDIILGRDDNWIIDNPISVANYSIYGHYQSKILDTLSVEWISGVGDMNGDGFDDFAIAEYTNDEFLKDAGKVSIFFGRSDWIGNSTLMEANASYYGEFEDSWAGMEIDRVGDLNNDGFSDMGIGAPSKLAVTWGSQPGVRIEEGFKGTAYVIYGKTSGWKNNVSLSNADLNFQSNLTRDGLGYKVSGLGDINGDGTEDFAISGMIYNPQYSKQNEGIVHVIVDHEGDTKVDLVVSRTYDTKDTSSVTPSTPTTSTSQSNSYPGLVAILVIVFTFKLRIRDI